MGVFAFGLRLGAHYGVDVGSIALDPFFTLGVGAAFGYGDVSLSPAAAGVELMLRAGTTLWFLKPLGVSLSLAYRRSDFYQGNRATGSRHITLRQLVVELAFVLRAGAA